MRTKMGVGQWSSPLLNAEMLSVQLDFWDVAYKPSLYV